MELTLTSEDAGEDVDDLYWRVHSLSKCLEASGRIDELDYPEAYSTLLDVLNVLLPHRT